MLTTLEQKIDPSNAVLITVDVQNDFCNPSSFPAKYGGRDVSMYQKMIDGLLILVDSARAVGLPIIHVRYEETPWSFSDVQKENRMRSKRRRASKLPHRDYDICAPGSEGAEFYRIKPDPKDIIVTKYRFSAFFQTNLHLILSSLRRKSLIFCGGGTNICVESSVRDAFQMDYYCVVVSDCTPTGQGEEAHKASLSNIEHYFGEVASLEQVLKIWNVKQASQITATST